LGADFNELDLVVPMACQVGSAIVLPKTKKERNKQTNKTKNNNIMMKRLVMYFETQLVSFLPLKINCHS
jgi:hypothetical protein